jgi:HlyD family secretion protein
MNAKKIILIVVILLVAAGVVGFTVNQSQKNAVTVQSGKVITQDITSQVTASGQIKPKTIVNVGANAMGRIVRLFVKEGDKVKKNQILAQLENVQSAADVAMTKATLSSSQTDAVAAEAALTTAQAQVKSSAADLARTKLEFDRAQSLYKNALMTRVSDVLSKTTYTAPFAGTVTNLPVHEGETVVMGIQNSPGSTLMTVADMSIITAEVQVDETDIVNVKLDQPAEVTIDAIPNQTFKGKVSEIGDNAIIRSTGVSTSQSISGGQEAKDFKVVITLLDPPPNLRPGLSATAKITTGLERDAVTIPIQALTMRDKNDLDAQKKTAKPVDKTAPAAPAGKKENTDLQGVFVIDKNNKAVFHEVQTGLTGTTEIQVKSGVKPGDVIITGSYKVLKTLRNGAGVKVDNSLAKQPES